MKATRTSRTARLHRPAVCVCACGAVVLLFLAGKPARAQQTTSLPAALERLFVEGVQAQKTGELEAAEKAFLEVLHRGGRVAYVYNNLGAVYQMRGDHARAITQFRNAVRLQPNYAAPRILMGASLLALGRVAEATRELERAVKLQPGEPLARQQLAKAHERAGNFPGLVDQFRALREIAPQEPEYAYQLGRAYLQLAGWCVREMARVNSRSARVYQARAENYRVLGQLERAVLVFQRAVRAGPKLPDIHLALAEIYLEQGKQAEARQEIERELAIVPESVAARALKQKFEAGESQPK